MKEEWQAKYRSALMERIPVLQQLRVDEAYQAVMRRMKETTGETSDERRKLDNALDMLTILRNRL